MTVNIRSACLWLHRYTSLGIVVFLLLAGITGSLLAFHEELDDLFNQRLAIVAVQASPTLPIATLHDNVISSYPEQTFSSMPTVLTSGKAAVFMVDRGRGGKGKSSGKPQNKQPPKNKFQEVYVNPYDGQIIGTRNKDEWAWRNTMWKVFWLHRDLLLGDIGRLILGIVALIWTLNCFVGFYLTLPRKVKKTKNKRNGKPRASILKRWLPAWKIRTKTNLFKFNYDLHQAAGLWLWGLLFVIAWSSVSFNLPTVYQPVMQAVTGYETWQQQAAKQQGVQAKKGDLTKDTESIKPRVGTGVLSQQQDSSYAVTKINSIATLGEMAEQAAVENGVEVVQLLGMRWVSEEQQWQLRFQTNKDVGTHGGASSLTVDAKTGEVVKVNFGYQAAFGNKADQWLTTLHMGHLGQGFWHLLYQLLLVIVGVAVALLSITGTYLWLKGRQRTQKPQRVQRVLEPEAGYLDQKHYQRGPQGAKGE